MTMKNKQIDDTEVLLEEPSDTEEFWFKLRIELSPLQRLDNGDTNLTLPLNFEGKHVEIKAVPKGPINKASTLDFDVHGFASHEEAHECGLRFRSASLLTAGQQRIGVDVGIDQTTVDQTTPVEDQSARTQGYGLKNELMGLTVHKGKLEGMIMLSDAHIVHLAESQPFVDGIIVAFGEDYDLDEKHQLALELYGLSHFETSERARFLVLTSVIEVLATQDKCPEETQKVINKILRRLKSSCLPKEQKEPLIDGLNRLRRQSISKACKEYVRKALGDDAADRFKKIYNTRSKLLHEGHDKKGNLGSDTNHLTHLIAAIFKKTFSAPQTQSVSPSEN